MQELPDLPTLAARLKWLRAQASLNQAELAALCSATKSYVSRLESGQRSNPSPKFLQNCSAALGVPADWFVHGTGPLPTPAPRPVVADAADTIALSALPVTPSPDLQNFFRVLFQTVPLDADMVLHLTAAVLDSAGLSTGFKHRAVIAANVAFHQGQCLKTVADQPPSS